MRASPGMAMIWSPVALVLYERDLWLLVLKGQQDLGVPTPEGALAAYTDCHDHIDFESIKRRELVTKHDIKARIEEFCALAGYEVIHRGMTSHDVVDNITQLRIRLSLRYLAERHDASELAGEADSYPLRGLCGPVGTYQDQLELLGSWKKCQQLDRMVADAWGFGSVLNSVGQIYPRSLDLGIAARVQSLVHARCPTSPWRHMVAGYLQMCIAAALDQWNEGDVSYSATRRVALPGLFYAADIALGELDTESSLW